ncbi:hypothetical protein CPAV1605_945 [seawater metagenome]|uniref:Glutaredoxin domain-containing protein n=1 Tax=seawater metagenome TaxID=1561972 RepID=A0A5E8CMF2_9ZZZZ
MPNILFFSNQCNYCSAFIALLKKENISDIFNFINVDENPELPDYIKKVPTIMVDNVTKPLVGKAAFNWVQMQTDINNQTNNIKSRTADTFQATTNKGPGGFTEKEMTGISDSFSFVAADQDKDMKKSYNFVEEKEEEIFIAPEEILTHKNQTKHLDNMMEQRKIQDREFIEDDECDDLVDIAYNNVAYNTKPNNKGIMTNQNFTRQPKKDNPKSVKKINSGIAGYNFMQFN